MKNTGHVLYNESGYIDKTTKGIMRHVNILFLTKSVNNLLLLNYSPKQVVRYGTKPTKEPFLPEHRK
jgi:hypothetical protein